MIGWLAVLVLYFHNRIIAEFQTNTFINFTNFKREEKDHFFIQLEIPSLQVPFLVI